MIVDAPNEQLRDLFETGLAIQSFTLGLIGSGRSASEIDSAVRHRYEQLGLTAEWRHHVGHSVGLRDR